MGHFILKRQLPNSPLSRFFALALTLLEALIDEAAHIRKDKTHKAGPAEYGANGGGGNGFRAN